MAPPSHVSEEERRRVQKIGDMADWYGNQISYEELKRAGRDRKEATMVTQGRERPDSSDDPHGYPTDGEDLATLALMPEEWRQELEWRAWLTGYLCAPDPDRYAACWPAPARPEKRIGYGPLAVV
jgi:hypothetical protein